MTAVLDRELPRAERATRPLRPALAASFFPRRLGGAEASIAAVVEELERRGHPHRVVSLDGDAGVVGHLPRWLRILGLGPIDTLIARRLAAVLRAEPVDVIHAQDAYCLLGALAAGEACGVPVVASYRNNVGVPHRELGAPAGVAAWLDRRERKHLRAAARCSVVVANSEATREGLVAAGLPPAKVRTVHNPVALTADAPVRVERGHGAVRVVAAGRLQEHKGFHVLLEAGSRLEAAGTPLELVVAGEGPFQAELRRRAAELGLGPAVRFTGLLGPEQLTALYDSAELAVVPSLTDEPFGRAAAEAMARGLPVVASRAGGLPEIVDDGRSGFLVRPGSSAELADRIGELAADAALRRRMGDAGLACVRSRFAPEAIVDRLLGVYADATEGSAR